MSKKHVAIILFLAVIMLLSGVLPAFANQINQRQSELNSLRGDLTQQRRELSQNKQEQDKILREINTLESEMNVIRAALRSLANRIHNTERQIAVTEAELLEAEEQIEIMEEVLAVRLRAIHENGRISYLDVLFSSSSFSEFLTRFNDMQMVIAEDRVLLEESRIERERIASIRVELEGQRQELLAMRRENLQKDQQLQAKANEQRQLVAALQEEFEATEKAVRQLEADAKQLEQIIRNLQAAAARKNTVFRGAGQKLWPVPEFGPRYITSHFGIRRHPITGVAGTFHGGVDIGIYRSRWPASQTFNGSPVHIVAADSGVAYTFSNHRSYGNFVIIDHGNGIATVYAHAHSFLVSNGQNVSRGQAIAIVGSTGSSTGPHLHFEVRVNGRLVNPLPYIR